MGSSVHMEFSDFLTPAIGVNGCRSGCQKEISASDQVFDSLQISKGLMTGCSPSCHRLTVEETGSP
eukprot:5876647-Amphidinium_carterae.1